jgi:hypothetical protein
MVCFQTKNPNFGKILEDLAMEESGILYDHLVNFPVIGYSLWQFGILSRHLVFFPVLEKIVPRKIWQS